jgi:hypothetical protein
MYAIYLVCDIEIRLRNQGRKQRNADRTMGMTTTRAGVGTTRSGGTNNNRDKSNTRQPETFSYSPSKHSPVKRREDQSTVHADVGENDEGDDGVEGLRPLEIDSKDEQEFNTTLAGASTLRGGLKVVIA